MKENDIYYKKKYRFHQKKNSLKWIMQGSLDKHFFKPYGKSYHYVSRKLAGKRIMGRKEFNDTLSEMIRNDKPFWMARYGHTEMRFINSVLYKRYIDGKNTPENASEDVALKQLCNNAGFFPVDISLGEKYVDKVIEAASNIDIHAMWDLWMEEYMLDAYEKDAAVSCWKDFAPYYLRKRDNIVPWVSALEGKKVLVVNPFADSITKQYEDNRQNIFKKIFDSDVILPKFELICLKAVQTSGGTNDERFENWFEALDYMVEECKKIDFDIALIGCGAYGFLLANEIKKMGKSAIQSCGCTQMLFGVLGKRWTEDNVLMSEVVNEFWVRPGINERPQGLNNVESGCYW